MDRTPALRLGFKRIFHPTDLTHGSEIAFAHALKLAIAAKAELEIIHVAADADAAHWGAMPGVRQTLARWDILPEHAPLADVEKIGVRVYQTRAHASDPAGALVRRLQLDPAELIVLATHCPGLDRWLHQEVANTVARRSTALTLFVPHGVEGFVALHDGSLALRRILLPVDSRPCPQLAVEAAAALVGLLDCRPADFNLLHVGPPGADFPAVRLPQQAGWSWGRTHESGDVVKQVLTAALDYAADLIVVATQGHDGFLDMLRGSTTERILRAAPCPVLAIPARPQEWEVVDTGVLADEAVS